MVEKGAPMISEPRFRLLACSYVTATF